MIEAMWEHNLAKEFIPGIADLNMKGYRLSLMNEDFSDIKVELIDSWQVLSADIDRRKNHDLMKIDLSYILKDFSNSLKVYWPK